MGAIVNPGRRLRRLRISVRRRARRAATGRITTERCARGAAERITTERCAWRFARGAATGRFAPVRCFAPLRRTTRCARAGLLFALLLPALFACSAPPLVEGRSLPALRTRPAVKKAAVAPFIVSPTLQQSAAQAGARTPPARAAELIAHRLSEALASRNARVVSVADMARALSSAGIAPEARTPERLAEFAAQRFGADALIYGRLTRWRERIGGGAGSKQSAAVGFRVELRSAPDGALLWEGAFNESQKPAGGNLLTASRYPSAGLRWLSAEELARWGAGHVADALPLR